VETFVKRFVIDNPFSLNMIWWTPQANYHRPGLEIVVEVILKSFQCRKCCGAASAVAEWPPFSPGVDNDPTQTDAALDETLTLCINL
jgi:hypothetical protein